MRKNKKIKIAVAISILVAILIVLCFTNFYIWLGLSFRFNFGKNDYGFRKITFDQVENSATINFNTDTDYENIVDIIASVKNLAERPNNYFNKYNTLVIYVSNAPRGGGRIEILLSKCDNTYFISKFTVNDKWNTDCLSEFDLSKAELIELGYVHINDFSIFYNYNSLKHLIIHHFQSDIEKDKLDKLQQLYPTCHINYLDGYENLLVVNFT